MSSKCRICLNESEGLYSIFASDFISNISEKIERYSGITIRQEDCYPQSICVVCIEELRFIEKFIEKCRQSDEILREVEVKVKDEIDNNEDNDWMDSKAEDDENLPFVKYEDYHEKDIKIDGMFKNHKNRIEKKEMKKKKNNYRYEAPSTSSCVCDLCGLKTKSSSAMETHFRIHSGEKPYECTLCSKTFAQKSTLCNHLKNKHRNVEHSSQYTISLEGDKRFFCETCGKSFKCRTSLKMHLRVHSGERPYKCDVCNKGFTQHGSLSVHKRRHRGEKPYSCDICQKTFVEMVHLKRHSSVHSEARLFICSVCGKGFKCRTSLKIHLRVHSDERPYKCNVCNKGFTQQGSLSVHQRRHRGERPYCCDICQKTFVEMTHLKRHRSVHSEARPFICSICGKGLKSPFALKQHIKVHSNCKEHVCDKCGMSFTIKGSLDSHVKVVHSERSGQCTICNKICSNLNDHMLLHTGEKPHCCEVCNKRFCRKRGLIIHSKTHTEGGKYECSVPGCEKTFYAQWVLECHLLKHSGNTPFVCKLCKKGFVRLCHLNKHLKSNHPNDDSIKGDAII